MSISTLNGIEPRFVDIAPEFIEFTAGDTLLVHNALFDMEFLRAECRSMTAEWPHLSDPELVIDTLPFFRKRHPGERCCLSALFERYGVSHAEGEGWHGALSDARMLARLWRVSNAAL